MEIAAAQQSHQSVIARARVPGSVRHTENLAAVLPPLPADHPKGTEATVTLVCLRRAASGLHEPTLSTFIVDYSPGGAAVLHRAPSSGHGLAYVLSGASRAFAWDAGVDAYRAGETWAEPAFAHNIATTNASTAEPARALVVLVTAPDLRKPRVNDGGEARWTRVAPLTCQPLTSRQLTSRW
jgi:hypothetical protein